ncbi:MAG: 3-deoxy-manno-octulosonate cytidylyltransferase [Alphaproteobacteria bacterium]|nr:MAG: 3-deoxy-manno-octulosonate cytidylyltransferase [Alphaproteobacteria bacterium]
MRVAIIIPARYGSTRLQGKPLLMLAGKTMLERVVELSRTAITQLDAGIEAQLYVATDHDGIADHARMIGADCLMTPSECATGTDRVAHAVAQLNMQPDFVLNMQGDAPFTPPHFLSEMIHAYRDQPCDVITPVTQLSWAQLDALRTAKISTPFSGTCAVFRTEDGRALWFSKKIIPAIRKESAMRSTAGEGDLSPVYRHIGLYGYRTPMLATYATIPETELEQLEGLEQLRILEHGYVMRCVPVSYHGAPSMSGIDSPEDVVRAEALLA